MIESTIVPWLVAIATIMPWEWLWAACALLFRARYSVATMLLPGLLAGFALRERVPGTLYSLLLLRVFEKGEPRISRTLNDIFFITAVSFTVAGLGAMGVRLVEKHGDQRLSTCAVDAGTTDPTGTAARPDGQADRPADDAYPADAAAAAAPVTDAATTTPPRATADVDAPGWPCWLFLVCGLCGLVFPVVCVCVAWREDTFRGEPRAGWKVLGALLAGGLVVVGLAWLIGVARLAAFGPDDWILPFPCGLFAVDRTQGTWLSAPVGRLLTRLGADAGYVDSAGGLYRSHIDMALVVLVAALVYCVSLVRAIRTQKPAYRDASTGIYLLIVIGVAGTVLGGVAFWGDRYGISPPLLAAGWAALIYRLYSVDHFFELFDQPHADAAAAAAPPLLADCFATREFPEAPDGRRTMIVATAAGGGIQAAAWAAEVLTGLATTVPRFRDSLGLLSGVSGGSVGCAYYLTGAWHDPAPSGPLDDDVANDIRGRARSSLLEPVSWGVAFPEITRLFTALFPWNVLIDRGWALERAIERRLDASYDHQSRDGADGAADGAPAAAHARTPLRMRGVAARIAAGALPVPLFNSTVVQTGQRVVIAPVRWFPGPPAPDDGVRSLHLMDDYAPLSSLPANPSLATAVRLSATFSYASPVARPLPAPAHACEAPGAESAAPAATADRSLLGLHLCDGGYADNTGVVSAVEACEAILAGLPASGPRPFDRILFLRIEPFPLDDRASPTGQEGFWKATLGPVVSLLSARVATQLERADHELERLAAQAGATHGIEVAWTTIRFGDPVRPGGHDARPPLSWALSTAQQNAVVASWEAWRGHAADHEVVRPALPETGTTACQVALRSMLRVARAT